MFGLIFLAVGCLIGFIVFRLGLGAGWHWAAALGAALIPIGLTVFLGIFGLIIAALFASALWKATLA